MEMLKEILIWAALATWAAVFIFFVVAFIAVFSRSR